jgi:cytidylate kinase
MKIQNPNFADPLAAWVAANKAAVQAWLAAPAQAAMREISFDYIRANVPSMAGKKDGELAEICKALGLVVVSQ